MKNYVTFLTRLKIRLVRKVKINNVSLRRQEKITNG